MAQIDLLAKLSKVSKGISLKNQAIAYAFLEKGSIKEACTSQGVPKGQINGYSVQLLNDKLFKEFIAILKEIKKNEAVIDKEMIISKLQAEFLNSDGITTAKLSQPLLKLLGLDKTVHEVQIVLPDEVRKAYKSSFNVKEVETADFIEIMQNPEQLISKNEKLISEVMKDLDD
jgi:hypothetical protein